MAVAAIAALTGRQGPEQQAGQQGFDLDPQASEGFSFPGSVVELPVSVGKSVLRKGREILVGGESRDEEPLYSVEGVIEIAGHETRYTITATESCDPERGLAIMVPGLIGFKTTSKPMGESNARIGGEYTLRFGSVRHDGEDPSNNFSNPALTQANALSLILDHAAGNKDIRNGLPGGDKIDLNNLNMILHSLGAVAGTDFILRNQGKVKNARYLASVGLGSPTLNELVEDNTNLQGAFDLASDLLPVFSAIYQREGMHGLSKVVGKLFHYHQRPERVAAEIILCLTANIEEGVEQIEAETSLQEYELDTLVRPDSTRARLVGQYSLLPGLGHCAPQHSSDIVAREIHTPRYIRSGAEVLPEAA